MAGDRNGSAGFLDLPPVWMVGAGGISWLCARLLPLGQFEAPLVGLAIAGAGILVAGWAALWFWRKRTPIEPRHLPRALIVEGPYRLNRNPIYTGMIVVLTGFAVWLGAPVAFLPVIGFAILINRRFVRAEEDGLRAAFGDAAHAYLSATRRW